MNLIWTVIWTYFGTFIGLNSILYSSLLVLLYNSVTADVLQGFVGRGQVVSFLQYQRYT